MSHRLTLNLATWDQLPTFEVWLSEDDESGLGEVGGFSQTDVWAGDFNWTQYLTGLCEPTTPTPTPAPVEPT